MQSIFNAITEKEDLQMENSMMNWKLEKYEDLIEELLDYLCQEDIFAVHYKRKYRKIRRIEMVR
ncbi:MAG: hypothetical protein ACRDDX_08590 [Cellulosilyticaceae bacterium]